MKRFRTLIAGSFAVIAGLASVHACGGKLLGSDIPGSLEDGGVFLLPDGGVLFAPGSGCGTFNAKAWLPFEAGPTCLGPPCDSFSVVTCSHPSPPEHGSPTPNTDPACNGWISTTGVSYPMDTYCLTLANGDGGVEFRCTAGFAFDAGALGCNPGPEGDAYCSAFFQQFVKGDGRAIAQCWIVCDPQNAPANEPPCCQLGDGHYWAEQGGGFCPPSNFTTMCVPTASGCGELGGLPVHCVQRPGGQPHAEMLCQDP